MTAVLTIRARRLRSRVVRQVLLRRRAPEMPVHLHPPEPRRRSGAGDRQHPRPSRGLAGPARADGQVIDTFEVLGAPATQHALF